MGSLDLIYLAQVKAQYRVNTVNKLWGSIKLEGTSWAAEETSASEQRLCYMELVFREAETQDFFVALSCTPLLPCPLFTSIVPFVMARRELSYLLRLQVPTWGTGTNVHILIPFELQVLKLTLPWSITFSYVVGSIKLTSITLNAKKRPYGLQRLPDELRCPLNLLQRREVDVRYCTVLKILSPLKSLINLIYIYIYIYIYIL